MCVWNYVENKSIKVDLFIFNNAKKYIWIDLVWCKLRSKIVC